MSELRTDPITGRDVIIAETRSQRPGAFDTMDDPPEGGTCPFCAGNESLTPGEVAALRRDGTRADEPGWQVRVVPNKYPATVTPGGAATGERDTVAGEDDDDADNDRATGELFQTVPASGAHEVIIESPRHIRCVTELSASEQADVFRMYASRLADHRASGLYRYGLLFKNVGSAAGASMPHTHSQLIALAAVPAGVAEELAGSLEFHTSTGRCVYCRMIELERSRCARVVAESKSLVAVCPFASRFPYETWLLPREHASEYESVSSCQAGEVASLMARMLRGLERLLDRPAYNYFIHSAPFDTHTLDHYHWHIELIPRLTKIAGFECGSGVYINPVAPETAARQLREVLASE
jgi:UDPglucose--hexose-1-phosphate uridylyltransferase